MADDPYKPPPRPVGPNIPRHPHYARENHKRLAMNEASPTLFLGEGETFPDGTGTHVYNIGDGGSAVGFYATIFGGLTPDTLGGSQIEYLQVNSQGTFQLGTIGGAQIGANTYVAVEVAPDTGEADGVHLTWNPSFNDYRAQNRVDIWNFLSSRKGTPIAIKMLTQQEVENPSVPQPTPLPAAIEAMLAGTSGFALDTSDAAVMWTTPTMAVNVSGFNDPVGAIMTKGGTTQYVFEQATPENAPVWDGGGGLVFNGTTARLVLPNADLLRAQPAAYVHVRVNIAALNGTIFGISGVSLSSHRALLRNSATGVMTGLASRDDATADRTLNTASAFQQLGDCTVAVLADYTAATNGLRTFRNDGQAAQTTLNGTPGPSEDSPSTVMVLGDSIQQIGTRFNGKVGRMVFLPFNPTTQQRTDIEAWLAETPLALAVPSPP